MDVLCNSVLPGRYLPRWIPNVRVWYFPGVTVEILSTLASTSQLESHRVVDCAGDACAQFEYFKVHSF